MANFTYNIVSRALVQTVMVVISSAWLFKYFVLANMFSVKCSKYNILSIEKRGLVL
jgi:hypothetical protein